MGEIRFMNHRSCDHVRLLSSSPERARILEFLRENPSDPRDIADTVSKSRRCVQRDLSKFEDRKWVERQKGAYQLTTYGAAIVTQYTNQTNAISLIDQYDSLFRHLPDLDHLPDPRWLPDAEIAIASAGRPHAPLHLYVNGIRDCSTGEVRGIVPVFSRSFGDAHTELLERGVETKLVVDTATIGVARSTDFEGFAGTLRLDAFDLYEREDPVEFGLTLADDRGFLGAYDEQGRFVACVEFTDAAFFDWAEGLYERYREQSALVEPEEVAVGRDSSTE